MTAVNKNVLSSGLPLVLRETPAFITQMIMGKIPSFSQLVSDRNILKSFLWEPDSVLFHEERKAIQSVFSQIIEEKPKINAHLEVLTYRLISLIPFLAPLDGDRVTIPPLYK